MGAPRRLGSVRDVGFGPGGREGEASIDPILDHVVARALGAAPPRGASVVLRQRGELRLAPGNPWKRVRAEQVIHATTPAFRWTAGIRMAPGVRVRVVDAFEDGRGRLRAKLWGLVPLAGALGPQVDTAELLRYLAELPWCPLAYRDNPALTFRQLDPARLEVRAATARIVLTVDPDGDVVQARAEARPRRVGDAFASSPWSGVYTDHGPMGGLRVPRRAVVTWHLEEGPFECFRGEIVSLRVIA